MEYQIIWFALWGILWSVYFMTDGFDFGVGILLPFVGKDDLDKRVMINSIGPVWDGNEVWLVTAGGATFAAFPVTYALMFSYLYSALLVILIALIFRGVAFEFRGQVPSERWRRGWDAAAFLGSLIPALFFGVAFGNIFQGLPMDASGYHGTLLGLLNPYGLLTGIFFVVLFVMHGTLWLAVKTTGDVAIRASALAIKIWVVLLLVAVLFLVQTAFATSLYANYLRNVGWIVVPALAVAALVVMGVFILKKQYLGAFFSCCLVDRVGCFDGHRRTLSQSDPFEPRSSVQPDGLQLFVQRLYPEDHDRRCPGLCTHRDCLPDMGVPCFQAQNRPRGVDESFGCLLIVINFHREEPSVT